MIDKQPMQAAGTDTAARTPDGVKAPDAADRYDAGQSAGGAYPNPHTGSEGKDSGEGGWSGHGGQSEIKYHGPGQLGDDKIADAPDPNATTGR